MARKTETTQTPGPPSVKGIPPGYEVLHRCGEGTFGQVFLCKDSEGKHVAIKTIKQEGAKQESEGVPLATIREASLLKELMHPNILHLEMVYVNSAAEELTLSLVFEFVDHDLHEMMQVQKGYTNRSKQLPVEYFPSDMVCSIMHQIIKGLEYLHTNWIIHRDMKPSNILVSGIDSDDPGRVRIADFGLARVYRAPPRPLSENGVVVTIWYRAPELLLGTAHYTPAVDMWAVGCIFGELLTLNAMFPGSEVREPLDAFQHDQLHKIMSIMGPFSEESWPEIAYTLHWKRNTQQIKTPHREYRECLEAHLLRCNPTLTQDSRFKQAVDLIKQYDPSPISRSQYNPVKRLTAREALQHPYFQQLTLPKNCCYPSGYKPRYSSKAAREQQKKKPVAGVSAAAAASKLAPGVVKSALGSKAAAGKVAGTAGIKAVAGTSGKAAGGALGKAASVTAGKAVGAAGAKSIGAGGSKAVGATGFRAVGSGGGKTGGVAGGKAVGVAGVKAAGAMGGKAVGAAGGRATAVGGTGAGGASGSSRRPGSSAVRNNSGYGQAKGRNATGTSTVNRVEKKGAHVKKKLGKSDK